MSEHCTPTSTATSAEPGDNAAEARALDVSALADELETMTVLVQNLVATSQRCTTAEEFDHWQTSAAFAVAKMRRLARWSKRITVPTQ